MTFLFLRNRPVTKKQTFRDMKILFEQNCPIYGVTTDTGLSFLELLDSCFESIVNALKGGYLG